MNIATQPWTARSKLCFPSCTPTSALSVRSTQAADSMTKGLRESLWTNCSGGNLVRRRLLFDHRLTGVNQAHTFNPLSSPVIVLVQTHLWHPSRSMLPPSSSPYRSLRSNSACVPMLQRFLPPKLSRRASLAYCPPDNNTVDSCRSASRLPTALQRRSPCWPYKVAGHQRPQVGRECDEVGRSHFPHPRCQSSHG